MFDCHECECGNFGQLSAGPCIACENCRHRGDSFPHCPSDCTECDCYARYEQQQERDKNVNEYLKSAPEATFEKVYGYAVAGEIYWAHDGGIFDGIPELFKLAPAPEHLDTIHARQRELAKVSGATLNPDTDLAVVLIRDRVVTLGTPSILASAVIV